jgi:hypothetical protein
VVLQSEQPSLVNNAQMASVPGAPLWADMMAAVAARARQGVTDPLHATGPHLLTQVLRVRRQRAAAARLCIIATRRGGGT